MTSETEELRPGLAILALLALLCSVCATALESMAVSVTLPAIARDFDIPASTATWVMGAAQFVIVVLLLPMAALGEVLGHRRLLLTSLGVFCLASAACMVAPGFWAVAAGRGLQAIGTAGAMSLGFAMLRSIFSDERLGTAIGIVAATVAVASSVGPAVAGFILTVASWREVFGLLVAISLIALIFGSIALPHVPPSGGRYDSAGALLVTAMLTALLIVVNGIANGWPLPLLIVSAMAFAAFLALVLTRSRGAAAPVFPVDLFARPIFATSITASVCAFTAQTLGFILLPFYLLYGAGMNELQMALTLSVWPAVTAVLAPILGRFAHRLPAGPTGAIGLAVLAAGFVMISQTGETGSPVGMAIRLGLCGAGFALFQTPNNRLIMLSAPRNRSGAASGTLSLARQFGRAIGTALAALVLAAAATPSLNAMLLAAAMAAIGAAASAARAWLGVNRAAGT